MENPTYTYTTTSFIKKTALLVSLLILTLTALQFVGTKEGQAYSATGRVDHDDIGSIRADSFTLRATVSGPNIVAPGASFTVSASGSCLGDDASGSHDVGARIIDGGGRNFPGNYIDRRCPPGGFASLGSLTLTAPTTPGTYYYDVYALSSGAPDVNYSEVSARLAVPGSLRVDVNPTGDISASPNPCTIATGSSQCLSNISWSTANVNNAQVYIETGTLFSGGLSHPGNPAPWIKHEDAGGRTFTLRTESTNSSNGIYLDDVYVYGVCEAGASWNGSICALSCSAPSATIRYNGSTANQTVNVGSFSQWNWSSLNGDTYYSTLDIDCPGIADDAWYNPWNWAAGDSGGTSSNNEILPSQSGCAYEATYYVTNACGTTDSDPITVTVRPFEAPVCSTTVNACTSGTPSSLPADTAANYLWTCSDINGSGTYNTTASCSQAKAAGSCGSADGNSYTSAPSSGLCSVGSISWSDSSGADGTYNWSCVGGTTASCSADRRYTVSYNSGTATGGSPPSSQNKYHNTTLILRTNTGNLTRTGYTFAGWDTASNGSGTDYASGGSYTVNASDVLYPRWNVATPACADPGSFYTFATGRWSDSDFGNPTNWNVSSLNGYTDTTSAWISGPTPVTGPVTGITASRGSYPGNATMIACGTPATYTVSYNGNGNTSGSAPSSQTKTHDVDLTLRTNTGSLAKTGYTYSGWNTSSAGNGTSYAAGGNYTANASDVLYAKWLLNPPTGLSASPGSCGTGQINVSWNARSGATGYDIRIDGGSWTNVGNVTSYTHSGLAAGSSHNYRIRAWNAAGAGAASSLVNATAPSACSYSCTGADPSNAISCGDTNPSVDTPKTVVNSCTSGTDCEFICNSGYVNLGGVCTPRNLTSNIIPTVNGTLTQGQSVTFDGVTRNTGQSNIATDFASNFTYRWGTSGSWLSLSSQTRTATLNLSTNWTNLSSSFNLANSGTLQVQHCVDSSGTVTETNETAADNCKIATFNVTTAPLPDLTASNSSPANGSSFLTTDSITFTGQAHNSATAAVSQGGWAVIEFDVDGNGTVDADAPAYGGVQLGSFNTSQSKPLTYTALPSSFGPTTYRYRFHVDVTGSGVAESDEGNNYSPWRSFTVSTPNAPTVNLTWADGVTIDKQIAYNTNPGAMDLVTADADTCSKSAVTSDWASSGALATSYDNNLWHGNGNHTADKTYTVSCTGPGGTTQDTVTATIGAPSEPPAPTVNAASCGTGRIDVSWSPVSGATGYNLQYKLSSDSSWTSLPNVSSVEQVTGLTTGASYDFQLQAYNTGGNSPWSAYGTTNAPSVCTYSCGAGDVTTNATLCPGDGDPTSPGETNTVVSSCGPGWCEYICTGTYLGNDYKKVGNRCVAGSIQANGDVGNVDPAILSGDSVDLTWSVDNEGAFSCFVQGNTGANSESLSALDPQPHVSTPITADPTRYDLGCNPADPVILSSVLIPVVDGPTITSNPRVIEEGDEVDITLTVPDATLCRLTGGAFDDLVSDIPAEDLVDIVLEATTTFTVDCGIYGDAEVTVEVLPKNYET